MFMKKLLLVLLFVPFTCFGQMDYYVSAKGNYKLGVRIVQPMAEKPKNLSWGLDARNTYILFSNELQVTAGSWKSDNFLKGGWSILGNIKVN